MSKEVIDKVQPIQELSVVIQGEGSLMGVPHLLIRFTGCRLRCQFAGSFCDTWYASWSPEKGGYSLRDIESFIKQNPHISHVFLTGGGPTLHKKLLPKVVELCKQNKLFTTIETEGSEFVPTVADLISLSPKMSNSTPRPGSKKPWGGVVTEREKQQHEKFRLAAVEEMKKFIYYQKSSGRKLQLKPVISTPEDLIEFKELQQELGVDNSLCWLMPEGITDDQLKSKRQWLFEVCTKEGYNFTDRLHVITYGNKRGV